MSRGMMLCLMKKVKKKKKLLHTAKTHTELCSVSVMKTTKMQPLLLNEIGSNLFNFLFIFFPEIKVIWKKNKANIPRCVESV